MLSLWYNFIMGDIEGLFVEIAVPEMAWPGAWTRSSWLGFMASASVIQRQGFC